MKHAADEEHALLKKIRELPEDKVAEVEDFVDFLRQRALDSKLTAAAAELSIEAFRRIRDNPDDADYDGI